MSMQSAGNLMKKKKSWKEKLNNIQSSPVFVKIPHQLCGKMPLN